MRLKPLVTYVYSLYCLQRQPLLPTVTAPVAYGHSLYCVRSQARSFPAYGPICCRTNNSMGVGFGLMGLEHPAFKVM